ncbi:MAG: glycosyltransferase family 2 protein [Chlorobi bacterium]|nr:glycosyltransferase family 2 protein [Chlorobiota bacterium]
MNRDITAFIPYNGFKHTSQTVDNLLASSVINNVVLVVTDETLPPIKSCEVLYTKSFFSTKTVELISENSDTEYTMILTQDDLIDFGQFALERFRDVAENTDAGLVYSDYYEKKNGKAIPHPVIDLQFGSLRDDFNFGHIFFYKTDAIKRSVSNNQQDFNSAGFYNLRLRVSQDYPIVRIPEYLYTSVESDLRKSGAKQFDYVDPKNREVQIEMEQAVTQHLKDIGAYLSPNFKQIELDEEDFENEASVIIPIKNRVGTITDAVESVLKQKTDFKFNLIVVDNYSDDGTTEKLKKIAEHDSRLIHVIPERKDLGIGGCWNEAVHSKYCGKFSAQLDSDDIYADENTLQAIVDKFHEEKCAMVIGSYKITDFELNEIPPGLIDHKEWTPENGRNNALRINGLGAPRAFYTPLLRKIKIPNVSYGEDYAVGLALSRNYQIGRIYTSIYLCRRWEGNSDAALDISKTNHHNTYKDRIRTFEVLARQKLNRTNG